MPAPPRPPRPPGGRPPRRRLTAGAPLATSRRELDKLTRERPTRSPADAPKPDGGRRQGRARIAAVAVAKAETHEPQRIAKLLARAGVGSRRDIERLIAEGKVAIGGRTLDSPATIITTLDGITVEGRPVAAVEATRLFRFHKPAGFLTTARDPGGRPTIFDILPPDLPRLVPVGRLDMNTEGLLLLTTDGGLKRGLELPINAVPRRYRVRAYGEISQAALEALAEGLTVDGMHYGPIDADVERRTGRNLWLTMQLTEGKNREVRRVLEYLGLQVSRLIRTAYGPFALGDLPPRLVDEATPGQIHELQRQLKRPARPK